MSRPRKGESSQWEFRTYDVWGNRRDGYEVNDSFNHGLIDCPLKEPSDSWLAGLMGLRNNQVDIDGDEETVYVNRRSDGKPLCELQREHSDHGRNPRAENKNT